MARARGYQPFHRSAANDALLARIVAHARAAGPGTVAVFDLDGCLFDTRPRQVRILREFAEVGGHPCLWRVREEHFQDWDMRKTLAAAAVDPAWVATHGRALRAWWEERFFTSEYVQHDAAMPGSVALVRAVLDAGVHVVYLTGRDETMRAGTRRALRAYGFPLAPELDEPADVAAAEAALLVVKPTTDIDDTTFKDSALAGIETHGRIVLYLDNEPANVNLYRRRHPESLVVFVETDHSPREDEPDADIPWLRSFWRG